MSIDILRSTPHELKSELKEVKIFNSKQHPTYLSLKAIGYVEPAKLLEEATKADRPRKPFELPLETRQQGRQLVEAFWRKLTDLFELGGVASKSGLIYPDHLVNLECHGVFDTKAEIAGGVFIATAAMLNGKGALESWDREGWINFQAPGPDFNSTARIMVVTSDAKNNLVVTPSFNVSGEYAVSTMNPAGFPVEQDWSPLYNAYARSFEEASLPKAIDSQTATTSFLITVALQIGRGFNPQLKRYIPKPRTLLVGYSRVYLEQ